MLSRAGSFLTTEVGAWSVIAFTGAITLIAYWDVGLSTYILSVEAIVLTQAVLAHQGKKERRDDERDVAMHQKLDGLVRADDRVDDRLAGIEVKNDEEC